MSYYYGIDSYEKFVKEFRRLSGLDLNYYKENQMKRRINSFMATKGHGGDYTGFLNALRTNAELYDAFFKHLTINVTQFFRDAGLWETFREKIMPALISKRSSLKIWSAGCSAGQEVYTIAMIMAEYFPSVKYSVLGTDIDVNVLKQAREGVYEERDFASTPPHLIEKYFTLENKPGKAYRIKDSLKKNVMFREQNLLTDNFEQGFDVIACRNVVIYFTDEAKDILYKKFYNSLNPGGILFTGSTEHLFGRDNLGFKLITSFFYEKQ